MPLQDRDRDPKRSACRNQNPTRPRGHLAAAPARCHRPPAADPSNVAVPARTRRDQYSRRREATRQRGRERMRHSVGPAPRARLSATARNCTFGSMPMTQPAGAIDEEADTRQTAPDSSSQCHCRDRPSDHPAGRRPHRGMGVRFAADRRCSRHALGGSALNQALNQLGRMFWLRWKMLSGSYCRLSAASRSSFSAG
jgi:hypothetical protein